MIRPDFLDTNDRAALTKVAGAGKTEYRVVRRALMLLNLDRGLNCDSVAQFLQVDDETVRRCYKSYKKDGLKSIDFDDYKGSKSLCTKSQKDDIAQYIQEKAPSSTREIGEYILKKHSIEYKSRSGIIKLANNLSFVYKIPKLIPGKTDVKAQEYFINYYNNLLINLTPREVIVFADAVHPTHEVRGTGLWALLKEAVAITTTSGRDRINIHGAVNLETGQTRMLEVETVDENSTINLFRELEAQYPDQIIHVFLDNARYHHSRKVRAWLRQKGCRIRCHFVPPFCPHLVPIERLWGLAHQNITHNTTYKNVTEFADAFVTFLKVTVPQKWKEFSSRVTDNFRVIDAKNFRIIT
jgi:transposase